MTKKIFVRMLITTLFALFGFSVAVAQEIDQEHLEAGQRMISATGLTKPYDRILPQMSAALKEDILLNNQGDEYRFDAITDIVDEETLTLASRRGNLEKEAVRLVVQTYTTEELDEITKFFLTTTGTRFSELLPYILPYSIEEIEEISDFLGTTAGRKMSRALPIIYRYTVAEMKKIRTFLLSDTGTKFHQTMPTVFSELGQAGHIWGDGIKRDLARNVMFRANQLPTNQALTETQTQPKTESETESETGDEQ